eukprot:CAMPEP_0173259200 /NCGR_PEP_ID=MMETSP1142-20121109/24835_1 /TAXON_ID=483371 /ORGANISM="non described non described, Strain CCMP2298" /LENGTH=64 /DNA_ID=CAMNT_0014193697 /DNA_START=376 /DNA_END=570 /DNA_ORIENTATION=-
MVAAELNLLDAANLTPASVSPITCSRPTKVGLCLAVLVFLPGAPVSSMVVMTEVIEDQKEVEIR